jgi:hypothetical protein
MITIAISGRKQTGKDTICDMIVALSKDWCASHNYISIKVGFADELYREVAISLLQENPFEPIPVADRELRITAAIAFINKHKAHFRLILQGWGTNYRRELCGIDYWIKKWQFKVSKFPDNTFLLVPDVRFMNEYEVLGSKTQVWRVNRETGFGDTHASEIEMPDDYIRRDHNAVVTKQYNRIFTNDGTIEELEEKVKEGLKGILI